MFSLSLVNFFASTESGGIVYAIGASNLAGKLILMILLVGSLFSWSVIASKFLEVRRVRRTTQHFFRQFRGERKPLSLFFHPRQRYVGSPAFEVYRAGCHELLHHLTGTMELTKAEALLESKKKRLSSVAMNAVRSVIERKVGEQALALEDKMILLATTTSGAPFLGLLGTVWGVMDAFSNVASQGSADLAILAPGVAGALVTTVTGLLVAIPAMFGYNFLVTTIRALTVELDHFALELVSAFEHQHLDTQSRIQE